MLKREWYQSALPGMRGAPCELHRLEVVVSDVGVILAIGHTIRDATSGRPIFAEMVPSIPPVSSYECLEEYLERFHEGVSKGPDPF